MRATELMKLPLPERRKIMEEAAALMADDYRNDPELTAFEANDPILEYEDTLDDNLCKLAAWKADPSQLEDDGVIPPSLEIIDLAIKVARKLYGQGYQRVIPDGDGGIVFRRRDGDLLQVIEINSDGTIEKLTFKDCKLIDSSAMCRRR